MTGPQPSDAPRTSRRRAVVATAAGLLPAGVLVGVLWSWIAPPIHGVVALTHEGDRLQDYLGDESEKFFVAPFLMLGLVIAAAAAAGVGVLLVHLRYGVVDVAAAPVSHDHPFYYFTEAPPVFFGRTPWQIACTLLLPASTAALVYAVPVAATARDDLGGYPAVDPSCPQPADAPTSARS